MHVQIVQDISLAHAITHAGFFHIGDVLATAILALCIPNLTVARVPHLPSEVAHDILVYDLDEIIFDTYQKNRNGVRTNRIPYTTAGHVWRKFGPRICANLADPPGVWLFVDKYLVQGVDDNDYNGNPFPGFPAQTLSVAQAVSLFNPQRNTAVSGIGNEGTTDSDVAFLRAVEFVSAILENTIRYADAATAMRTNTQTPAQLSNAKAMPWEDITLETEIPQSEYGADLKTKLCEEGGKAAYLQSDGTIRVISSDNWFFANDRTDDGSVLEELLRSCGYRGLNYFAQYRQLVFSFNGRNVEDLKAEFRRRATKNEAIREIREDELERWNKQQKELGNYLIGITDVDRYDGGFTVWVSLNTSYTFEEQRDFAQSKQKNIVAFVEETLPHKKKFKRQADILQFCQVVEIVITRQNAVLVKYELKPEIQMLLNQW